MKQYKAILFDLDGTLLDTVDDLADSMNAVLDILGFPNHPTESYKIFVGDGLTKLSERVLPGRLISDQALIAKCSHLMIEEYSNRWSTKSKLYPGIANMLTDLHNRSIQLNILSNKPHALTSKVVDFFLSDWPFINIVGAKPDIPRKPNPSAALNISKNSGFSASEFLYLGDTNTDMQTAMSAKMMAVGVLWGFRTKEELTDSGADILINEPHELLEYL